MPVTTSISRDGKTPLYTLGPRTMVLPLNGARAAGDSKPLRESTAGERQAQISPDGKLVAFTSTESGTSELYVMPVPGPGPKVRVSTQTANAPRWNRNGRWDVAPDGQHFLVELARSTGSGSTFATATNWFDERRRRAHAKK